MLIYLLAALLYANKVSISQDYFYLAPAWQQQIIRTLPESFASQPYKIYRPLPPLKRSIFSYPARIISADSAIVIDNMSGEVMWEKNAGTVLPIASLTKLMTALVFLNNKPDFSQEITIEESDNSNVPGSRLYVRVGEKMTVGDIFHASLIGSANNATKALARSTGLPENEFIAAMNDLAQKWNLDNTSFSDVTGLDPANKSTASEYSKIAREALSYSLIKGALSRGEYTFSTIDNNISHTIANTNKLLFDSDLELVGAKTGYLHEAGFTYVCQSDIAGNGAIVVLLNSSSEQNRFAEAKELVIWSHRNFLWL